MKKFGLLLNPGGLIYYLNAHGFFRWVPDKLFLKNQYINHMGRKLNIDNPVLFSEKVQWMKLNNRDEKQSLMVDKYEVKNYVANLIGEKYIIPTLGVWNRFEDIDFESLPNQFVLKCTHDSGSVVVCTDKNCFDFQKAKEKLSKRLKMNYYWRTREWPYKNVKPRIIAEKYIGKEVLDYKFFCFNGEIDSVMICADRESGHAKYFFYDLEWNLLDYQKKKYDLTRELNKPLYYEQMIDVVRKLASGFPHVRVDLYYNNGNIYFGELTFYNMSGYDTNLLYEVDKKWGEYITLT